MATFPDQLTDYLQPAVDKFTFTIAEALDISETDVDITGGTAAFEVPCVINIEDELMKVTAKTSVYLTVTRGFGGTDAATHVTATSGYLPLTAEHYAELIAGKSAVIKFLCRTESSLPVSDMVEYEVVEYADEIYAYNGVAWERIGITTSHDDWKNLDSGDPHPVYYLEAELESAHTALAGDHVTDGDSHDHLEGQGMGAIDIDIDRTLSTPTYDGEIILSTVAGVDTVSVNAGGTGYAVDDVLTITPDGDDNCTLTVLTLSGSSVATVSITTRGTGYATSTGSATTVAPAGGTGCTIDIDTVTSSGVLYTAYSSSWDAVVGAPSGLLMPFDPANLSSACPDGWSRYTALDEKFVKGTSGSSSSTGGSATHTHTYDATDVVTHSHSVSAEPINASDQKGHSHSIKSNAGTQTGFATASAGTGTSITSTSGGGHSHTGSITTDTGNTGDASPATDSVNGEPLYKKVIWCEKD